MANTQDFNGKWALVTGASAGIGAALARELSKHGAKLILTARRVDRIEALAGELRARGAEVTSSRGSKRPRRAAEDFLTPRKAAGVCVDILINNRGLGQYGPSAQAPWNRS